MKRASRWYGLWLSICVLPLSAFATRYVAPGGGNIPPYTNWAMAARNINTAMVAAAEGETVIVSNGTYLLNETVGCTSQRLVSVNGPGVTAIDGRGAVRCLWMYGASAVVEGFRISNGREEYGAGVVIVGGGLLKNCVVSSNRSVNTGGGVYVGVGGRLEDCTITRNVASNRWGGGVYFAGPGSASNCLISMNQASTGGGVMLDHGGQLRDCRLIQNSASDSGGGAYLNVGGELRNCLIINNEAALYGGGVFGDRGYLLNCTIAANLAGEDGGGLFSLDQQTNINTIIYLNATQPGQPNQNFDTEGVGTVFRYCCSVPSPGGVSPLEGDPAFVDPMTDNYHLRPTSPCMDWNGANATAPASDLDRVPRPIDGNGNLIVSSDLGCYEYVPGRLVKDYNNNQKSDLVVYDAAAGRWYVRDLDGTVSCFGTNWGFAGATPVSGDFNLDFRADLAVWHGATGNWYLRTVAGQTLAWATNWGFNGCVPVAADFNGDRRSDLGVWNPADGNWYVRTLAGTTLAWATNWGFSGCQLVAADYNADGKADLAVHHPATGNWYIRTLSGRVLAMGANWGYRGTRPVPLDGDGDGRTDLAVYDPATGNWYIRTLDGHTLAWAQNWGWASPAVSVLSP